MNSTSTFSPDIDVNTFDIAYSEHWHTRTCAHAHTHHEYVNRIINCAQSNETRRRDTVAEEQWSRSGFTVKLPTDIQPEFHF